MPLKFLAILVLAMLAVTGTADARDRWYPRERGYNVFFPQVSTYFVEEEDDEDWLDENPAYERRARAAEARDFLAARERRLQRDNLWWLDDEFADEDQSGTIVKHRKAKPKVVTKPAVKKPVAAVVTPKPVATKAVSSKTAAAKPRKVVASDAKLQPATAVSAVETAPKDASKQKLPRLLPVTTKPTVNASAKSASPIVATKTALPAGTQTASLTPPASLPAKPSGKTIGCTGGAAVVIGYGYGDVKPKICSGDVYAYTAARDGKNYQISLKAASGEITDVKKLQ